MFESINLSGLGPLVLICIHVLTYSIICTKFQFKDFNSFYKSSISAFSPYKNTREQSWPCCKVIQVHPKNIIWTNCVGFLSYMGKTAILVTWPGLFKQTFSLTTHKNFTSMGLLMDLQQMFESINLSDLGHRSTNDLDLWYSYIFMNSNGQLFVPAFS